MLLRQIARSAARSESARERIRYEGRTPSGSVLWTKREDENVRIESQKRLQWTAADISRLRRIYPSGTDADLAAAAFTKRQVQAVANRLRISKKKRYKRTGIAIIDAIRDRALELNLTMIGIVRRASKDAHGDRYIEDHEAADRARNWPA